VIVFVPDVESYAFLLFVSQKISLRRFRSNSDQRRMIGLAFYLQWLQSSKPGRFPFEEAVALATVASLLTFRSWCSLVIDLRNVHTTLIGFMGFAAPILLDGGKEGVLANMVAAGVMVWVIKDAQHGLLPKSGRQRDF